MTSLYLFTALLCACFINLAARADEHASPLMAAQAEYLDSVEKARAQYLKRVADIIANATSVELFRIVEKPSPDIKRRFPEAFNLGSDYGFTKMKTIQGAELKQWVDVMRELLQTARLGGAACHEPVYGLRVLGANGFGAKGNIIFETTLCWKCQNFAVGISFPVEYFGLNSEKLKELCAKALPID